MEKFTKCRSSCLGFERDREREREGEERERVCTVALACFDFVGMFLSGAQSQNAANNFGNQNSKFELFERLEISQMEFSCFQVLTKTRGDNLKKRVKPQYAKVSLFFCRLAELKIRT